MAEVATRESRAGWTTVAFGDVVRQVKDKVEPEESGLERYIAGEHMDTDDLSIRRWGEIGDGYLGPAFHMRFKPGHVLYGSRRTYLRKIAVADFEGITANTTYVLESADPVVLLPELLPFIMQTEAFSQHSVRESKGSTNPYVNFSDLAWFEFDLPPLEEQRRMVEVLEAFESCLGGIERLQSSLNLVKQSLLHDLLTRGLDANGELRDPERHPEQFQESDLGPIPEGWEMRSLGSVCRVRRGASPRPIKDQRWFASSGPGWVRIRDVTEADDRLLVTSQYLSQAGVARSVSVRPGQVIMSIAASIGIPIIVGIDACIHDGFVCFDGHESKLSAEFLVRLLTHHRRYFLGQGQTGTQANINAGIVQGTVVQLPPLPEQRRIAAILDTHDERIRQAQVEAARLRTLKSVFIQKHIGSLHE